MVANLGEEQRARERVKLSVDRASAIFAERNIRFTDLRRKVFEEIASTQASVGAYEVLDRLAKKGTRLAPISVYRALDALLEAGVVHRLESKNAYFACGRLHQPRTGKRPVTLDGRRRNVEVLGNLLVGQPLVERRQYLALTLRQEFGCSA